MSKLKQITANTFYIGSRDHNLYLLISWAGVHKTTQELLTIIVGVGVPFYRSDKVSRYPCLKHNFKIFVRSFANTIQNPLSHSPGMSGIVIGKKKNGTGRDGNGIERDGDEL